MSEPGYFLFSSLLLSSQKFSDTKGYEPWIRALLGTDIRAIFGEEIVMFQNPANHPLSVRYMFGCVFWTLVESVRSYFKSGHRGAGHDDLLLLLH